jgi:hypothetical protein
MSFDVEVPSEVAMYEARWSALIECMIEGLTLQQELRDALDLHKLEQPPVEERASKPEERVAQIKAKVDALMARYGGTVQKITVWFATLQGHLKTCQAHLDNVPLAAAINGVHEAVSRATRDRMPPKPALKNLEDPEALEARAKYLRAVQDVVAQSEGYPALVGNAIAALDETFQVFAREMDEARFKGQKSNTSAFRYSVPRHPLVGPPPKVAKAAAPVSDYEWLTR